MTLRFASLLVALSTQAVAGTISLSFSGTINNSLLPGISVGDQFSGTMTYETSGQILAAEPTPFPFFTYAFNQPNDGITITVDGFVFSGLSYMEMENQELPLSSSPAWDVVQGDTESSFGSVMTTNYSGATLSWLRVDLVGNLNFNPSNGIPNPLDIADIVQPYSPYATTGFGIGFGNSASSPVLNGYINSVTQTPEPSTGCLFCTMLLTLLFVRGRRSHSHRRKYCAETSER